MALSGTLNSSQRNINTSVIKRKNERVSERVRECVCVCVREREIMIEIGSQVGKMIVVEFLLSGLYRMFPCFVISNPSRLMVEEKRSLSTAVVDYC